MSEEPITPEQLGARLSHLLENLMTLEFGPARIANLVDGLNAKHIDADDIRALVGSLPPGLATAKDQFSQMLDLIGSFSNRIYFRRPSPPECNLRVSLVLPLWLLDEGRDFRLFSDAYADEVRGKFKTIRTAKGPVEDAAELAHLLRYVREGFKRGLARGLGAGPKVVFVTPVDTMWEKLTAGCFAREDDPFRDPGPANLICDYLGLPHRDVWLIELRSRSSLSDLIARGRLRLAAPTVIEAWGHNYFRHWPRDVDADPWGRTLRIADDFVTRAPSEGRPEAIVDELSANLLSTEFEVSILGRVTDRRLPRQEAVCNYLIEPRDLLGLVDEMMATVARVRS